MQVEHEVYQGALDTRPRAPVQRKAGACYLCGALHVQNAQGFAEFIMRFGLETENRFFTPSPQEGVVIGALAVGGGFMRRVGEIEQKIVLFLREFGQLSLHGFGLVGQSVILGQKRFDLLIGRFVALEFTDFFAALSRLRHPAFHLVGQIPPSGVDFQYSRRGPNRHPFGRAHGPPLRGRF